MKKNIQNGSQDGVYFVKKGAIVAKKSAQNITKAGKKKIQLYELHSQVQREMTELGGRIYALTSTNKNPWADRKVNIILKRIEKLETKITKLERKIRDSNKKTGGEKNIVKAGKKQFYIRKSKSIGSLLV
ncbi:MAG: hypothetical protein ACOYVJ_06580 [Nitrospirota bacterium]